MTRWPLCVPTRLCVGTSGIRGSSHDGSLTPLRASLPLLHIQPTFHELRALGVHLYTQAGYSKDYVTTLSGHASGAMFEHYELDHASNKPRLVEAGLGALFPEISGKYPEAPS